MYRAVIEIPCEDAEILKKAMEVEKDNVFKVKFSTKKNLLVVKIEASRISMLQAGINSVLKAVKAVKG